MGRQQAALPHSEVPVAGFVLLPLWGGCFFFVTSLPFWGNKKKKPQALCQVDIDVQLRESSGYDKVLSSLISAFCILEDSIPLTTQPFSISQCGFTGKINARASSWITSRLKVRNLQLILEDIELLQQVDFDVNSSQLYVQLIIMMLKLFQEEKEKLPCSLAEAIPSPTAFSPCMTSTCTSDTLSTTFHTSSASSTCEMKRPLEQYSVPKKRQGLKALAA